MSPMETNQELEALLDYLKRNRGFDFTGYKRTSLTRRIQRRMQIVQVASFGDYVDYLEVHPEEFSHLFNTILINVTGFFRDPPVWEFLRTEIIPQILSRKRPNEPIRAWSAGCATGEEAYTLSMLLAEAVGTESFQQRVKIYGTDVDVDELNKARQASYTPREVEGVPCPLLEKYLERVGARYQFHRDLRRSVIFGRHDLISDAPISRLDLLICRNTLMYFNAETQARILARMHYALNEGGFLFLGKAEMLLTHGNSFTPVELKHRVFVKRPQANFRDRLMMTQAGREDAVENVVSHARIRDAAFDTGPIAQVIVDSGGFLVLANDRARLLFRLSPQDLGRPIQDLEVSYRPVDLRSAIDQAVAERSTVILKENDYPLSTGEICVMDVQIVPLADAAGNPLGVCLTFLDVTRSKQLQEELRHSNEELETAYEELQSTNEELETTNEELQSTIEELETTNEELQSTNEELETMNEELHSGNEELQTMNEELRRRTNELNEVNSYLQSILTGLRGGVVVINPDLQVQVWSQKAEDLWGLRGDEVLGKHFLNLDIGLPVEQLKQTIRSVLADGSEPHEVTLEAINRRGKRIQCRVTSTRLLAPTGQARGVILLMEELEAEPGR
jgi:two-component system, chemotaxis family, CheB/CheR fusion protein